MNEKGIVTMSHDTVTAPRKKNIQDQPERLYPKDQERVDRYVSEGINKVERASFKPFHLMGWLTLVIVLLGLLSRLIGYFFLPL